MIRASEFKYRMLLLTSLLGLLAPNLPADMIGPDGVPEGPPYASKHVSILRTNNKAQNYHYVAKVYEFKNNNPYNVRRFLQRPLAVEEGGLFTYVNPDYKSGAVLIIAPHHMLDYYDKLIPYLDKPGQGTADGSIRDFLFFKHRSVADADFISAISTQMTVDSWLYTDTELNGVYISDAPSGYAGVTGFLAAEGGVPRDQVDVTVTIYEVNLNDDEKIGLDYFAWKNGPGQDLFSAGIFFEDQELSDLDYTVNGTDLGNDPLYDAGLASFGLPAQEFDSNGYYGSYQVNVPSQYFDYLAIKGEAKIVGETRLSVLDGDTGSIHTGDQMTYYAVNTDGSSRTLSAHTAETGLLLELTPTIGTEGILFTVDYDAVTLKGYDGSGVPLLATDNYSGKIRVSDGTEIILGGLNRTTNIETTSKIPVLGDIPILGGLLFGGSSEVSQSTMLAIVLQPSVIKNSGTNVGSDENMLISEASN